MWFEQNFFHDRVSVRIGQLGIDHHSFASETSGGLINGTFGWPSILAANMINGGPVRRSAIDTRPRSASAAVCWQRRTSLRIDHGHQPIGLPPGVYKLGFWYESAKFPNQRYGVNASGKLVPLADATVAGPLNHSGNRSIFGIIDQTIWQEQERSVSVFVRASVSPSDRNLISFYVDGGAGIKGVLPARPDDVLTLGVSYAKISPDAVGADQDALAVNGPPQPIRDHEIVFQVSYALQIAPWWIIQPDFQYIIHPGGNVANPNNPNVPVGDAVVAGLRSTFTF